MVLSLHRGLTCEISQFEPNFADQAHSWVGARLKGRPVQLSQVVRGEVLEMRAG